MWQESISSQPALVGACPKGSLHHGNSDTLVLSTEDEHPRSIIQNEMKLTERAGGAHMKF